jgi:hypothetical protein
LGESIHAIKKNTEALEALVVASKEMTTKYAVMYRDQHAGQNHNIQIGNKSFQRVEQFKYLGTGLTNQNSIHVLYLRFGN